MNDNPNPEVSNKQKSNYGVLISFVCVVIVCCGLYGFAMYIHNNHIVEGQNRIIKTYTQQLEKIENSRPTSFFNDNQREISSFHQEVKALLELEFNRIQNEFEAIEIWTGILTIIFLIFSFYSLFKTEQLEKQAKDELLRLKKINEDGLLKLAKFETDSETQLTSLKTEAERIKKDADDKITAQLEIEKSNAVTDLSDRARELLATYMGQLDELVKASQISIEKGYNEYIQKLQSAIDNDTDLDDYGEEELDEEELSKNQESEDKEG